MPFNALYFISFYCIYPYHVCTIISGKVSQGVSNSGFMVWES